MKIRVVEDTIVNVQADALLTAIRSDTMPLGRVDSAIGRCAACQFHEQAHQALMRKPATKAFVARKRQPHKGKFEHVVFIVDDAAEELGEVVRRGLDAAATAGFKSVSLPAIRFRNEGNSTKRATMIRSMAGAMLEHDLCHADSLSDVSIVIYEDPLLAREFNKGIAHAFSSL